MSSQQRWISRRLLPVWPEERGPQDHIIDDHDIRSLILDDPGATSPCDAFYYYYMDQLQAVRSGPCKPLLPLKKPFRHPHFRKGEGDKPLLFNVVTDVGSKSDVADEHQDIVERLARLAEKGREDLGDYGRRGKNQRHRGKVDEPQPQLMSAN